MEEKDLKKIILIVLILGLILISGCTSNNVVSEKTTKCIANKSTLYIKSGCPDCKKQEELFGENFKYLNIIDCKDEPAKCVEADIVRIPTWIINNTKIVGFQSIKELKELTGC